MLSPLLQLDYHMLSQLGYHMLSPLLQLGYHIPPPLLQLGYHVLGGYMSPVADAYGKPELAPCVDRVVMCQGAASTSPSVMVDEWEARQPGYTRTLQVLHHLQEELEEVLPVMGRPHREVEEVLPVLDGPHGEFEGMLPAMGRPHGELEGILPAMGRPHGELEGMLPAMGRPHGELEGMLPAMGRPHGELEGMLPVLDGPHDTEGEVVGWAGRDDVAATAWQRMPGVNPTLPATPTYPAGRSVLATAQPAKVCVCVVLACARLCCGALYVV